MITTTSSTLYTQDYFLVHVLYISTVDGYEYISFVVASESAGRGNADSVKIRTYSIAPEEVNTKNSP